MTALLFFSALLITVLLLLSFCPLAVEIGLTDRACSRKQRSGEVPLIGGISIYLCMLILFYWLPMHNYWYIVSATLIVVCGVIDDYQHLNHKVRLIMEAVAVMIMVSCYDTEISNLGNLFGFGDIQLGYFSPLVTIFAVVGGINAFNMTDGIDGSTGGQSLIIMGVLFALDTPNTTVSTLCLLYIPALIAFLFFNMRFFGRKKAAVFLGDAGSMLLGFTICYLAIQLSQGENKIISPVMVLWIIGLPLLDTVCIIVRRLSKGRSAFAPDREHFHHILLLAGYTVNQAVSIILLISVGMISIGVLGEKIFELPETFMFHLFLGVFFLYYWGMNHAWKVMKVVRTLHGN